MTSLIFLLLFAPFYSVAQEWQVEASLPVNKPGLIEVPLLAELHHQMDDSLDLKVIGPDGKSRPFELYWHEDKRDTILLSPKNQLNWKTIFSFGKP